MSRKLSSILTFAWISAACQRPGAGTSAHDSSRDITLEDGLARDQAMATPCSSMQCSANQYCRIATGGVPTDAGPDYSCQPIPLSCAGTLTCSCLGFSWDATPGVYCMVDGHTVFIGYP